MRITTKSGFDVDVDDQIFEEWSFMRTVRNADSDDPTRKLDGIISLEEILFSDKVNDYEDYIAKNNDGHIPADVICEDILDILERHKKLKNS